MLTCIQCPLVLVLPCIQAVPNGGNDPLCSANWASDIIQAELLHSHSVNPWGGRDHLLFPCQFCLSLCGAAVATQDMTALKRACLTGHGHLHELPFSYYFHGPIYYFGPNYNWNLFEIGCSWYTQY